MDEKNYRKFVDIFAQKQGVLWAAIILGDGKIPAYHAKNKENEARFLRATRSFFWTMMSMGDMVNMPYLKGKYLEVLWNYEDFENYLFMFQLKNEVLMLATSMNLESLIIKIISEIDPKDAEQIPGLIGFGIGDFKGNPEYTYIDMEKIRDFGSSEYTEEEVREIFEKATQIIFEKFMFMGNSGFGNGKYMEVDWSKVSGWMFPYKDRVAAAMFTTGKVDTVINMLSYLLENTAGD